MASQPPSDERHADPDGVVRIQKQRPGGGSWIVAVALAFTLLCVGMSLWMLSPESATADDVPPMRTVVLAPLPSAAPESPRAPGIPRPPPPARPGAPAAPVPAAAESPASPEAASSSEPAEGIHLYRQGTRPLKQGILVPEGFVLPKGYVRHYQTTDRGEQIKPILMFHDDYHPVDAKGQPVELPSNGVVPPELAPPGMPIEIVEIPAGPEGVEPLP